MITGYIKIDSFSKGTTLKTKQLLKTLNTNNIIIDLCDNPGGAHDELMGLFNLFAPKGPVLKVNNSKTYFSENKTFGKYNLVIIVNKNSASAAEAFAATMQEWGAAVIIGEKTYGKGTFSRLAEEKRRGGIVMSKGIYTTPGGRKIIGMGVIPDVEVKDMDNAIEIAGRLFCNNSCAK
ncbi:MAG: hypothetical protein IJY55_00720 [Clostridia bacterium]|nr:hypothetical protein [Clostridia bacterium]